MPKLKYKVESVSEVPGIDHILNDIEIPEYEAISLLKVGKTDDYAHVVLTIKDGKVTKMTAGEPNLWQIAADMAKIDFVKKFLQRKDV